MFTLLRICEAFEIQPDQLLAGLAQRPRKTEGRLA
jgi:DNA-binding Xre family transcriptional regulator